MSFQLIYSNNLLNSCETVPLGKLCKQLDCCMIIPLKGQCHEIFVCWFFHQIAPSGPFRGTLGRFQFFPKIRRDIQQKVSSAVHDTPQNGDLAE